MNRRARRAVAALVSVLVSAAMLGCSSDATPSTESGPASAAPITTVTTADRFPFDETSARQFPGTSLGQRLQMAQQVCDSIAQHGDDYPAWLKLTLTQDLRTLVPFPVTQQVLTSFSGLAVKAVCPKYLAQLQNALNSLSFDSASAGS